MRCLITSSIYAFINGCVGQVVYNGRNGLLEVLVEQHGRFVLAEHEIVRLPADG